MECFGNLWYFGSWDIIIYWCVCQIASSIKLKCVGICFGKSQNQPDQLETPYNIWISGIQVWPYMCIIIMSVIWFVLLRIAWNHILWVHQWLKTQWNYRAGYIYSKVASLVQNLLVTVVILSFVMCIVYMKWILWYLSLFVKFAVVHWLFKVSWIARLSYEILSPPEIDGILGGWASCNFQLWYSWRIFGYICHSRDECWIDDWVLWKYSSIFSIPQMFEQNRKEN